MIQKIDKLQPETCFNSFPLDFYMYVISTDLHVCTKVFV